jgi:hypothetical protein
MARGWVPLAIQAVVVLNSILLATCGAPPRPPPHQFIVWQKLGSWSGTGAVQTDPFLSATGMLRIIWQANSHSELADSSFRVFLHSAVSGRRLALVVDHRGTGRNTEYVNDDPREFYLVIESRGVDWSVEVAEGIRASRAR